MTTHDLRSTRSPCPGCGNDCSAASNADLDVTEAPKPGDFSICIECGEILNFTENMGLAVAKNFEGLSVADVAGLYKMQRAIRSQKL